MPPWEACEGRVAISGLVLKQGRKRPGVHGDSDGRSVETLCVDSPSRSSSEPMLAAFLSVASTAQNGSDGK